MRTRLIAAGIAAVAAFAPAGALAQHTPTDQPSRHCNGSSPQTTEIKTRLDTKQPGVCYAPRGDFKGAIWVDMKTLSVVVDGDSTNRAMNPCLDGYVGVDSSGSEGKPQLMWSQGGNYNPDAAVGDGGVDGAGAGHAHDELTADEAGEIAGCFTV